ncbi:muscle M-line assembly protein unc-89-like isoform X2 [Phymastichus coffea]|uniref:muscle M-line assembly protein unc-89-like isoform X2 n=1 Tax=Phymastichus coffea TaxID=108790 RepID=UPI00273B04A2|nr:muscle M-line assembly protein unc-89-like isoform X2 [Phymastichus coffea]
MKILLFLLAFLFFKFIFGLKEVHIQTPTAVKKGETTKLYCWFDTEGDPLYLVKWYKSGREFYRYVPQETPSIKIFPVDNIEIKESESNATQITLVNVNTDTAGSFSCEVSADAPSFQTEIVSGILNVVELPLNRPVINGLRSKYRVNDTLKLNCSSSFSNPAANLTWYINNKQVTETFITTYIIFNDSGRISSQSGLHIPIHPESFINEKLKIRCSASIYDIYWQSTEVSAEEEKIRTNYSLSTNNVIGINYHQPPPNFQLGQKKLNGEINVQVIGNSGTTKLLKIQVIFWISIFILIDI